MYVLGSGSSVKHSEPLTLRLDAKLKNLLDRLSKAMNRSRSFVAAHTVHEFAARIEWQIGEIRKAIGEADPGDFPNDREVRQSRAAVEVRQSLKRWTSRALSGCTRRSPIRLPKPNAMQDNPVAAARSVAAVLNAGRESEAVSWFGAARAGVRHERVGRFGHAVHHFLPRARRPSRVAA